MDEQKRKRLEAKGWKVGTVAEFLDLTPEESTLVEIKLALSRNLKERQQKLTTQPELANAVNAKNEDDSISIDLLIRAILATGATPQDIGQVIASIK
jgi:alkylhydroperoxidase/carboxymuconolactone decarboxylase family protein YurZ